MTHKVNLAAMALSHNLFRKRVVRPKKGKGSYKRNKGDD